MSVVTGRVGAAPFQCEDEPSILEVGLARYLAALDTSKGRIAL